MLLQRALELPSSAIGYHLGRELAAWAKPRAVLEMRGNEFDVWAFACAGRCDSSPRAGIYSQFGATWSRRGRIEDQQGTSWLRIQWEGHAIEAVMACWDRRYDRETCHWIIADTPEIARAFATEVADFCSLPPAAALVFANGCWDHDEAAFAAIQQARKDDLILPPEFLERILGDARHFLNSRSMYAQYGLPYKRGLLFAGPPGNGKTACLRVLLREVKLPILIVRSFASRYSEVEQNVASAFDKAKRAAPCALVLEDLDVLVRGSALSALLNEMDGLGADTGILTLATSNHPEQLDPALIDRPSRFDRVYRFNPPGPEERRRFFARWNQRLEGKLRIDEKTIGKLVERTADFSFAFLQELLVSAMVRWVADPDRHAMSMLLQEEVSSLVAQRRTSASASVQRQEE
jgi:hypothetical protein